MKAQYGILRFKKYKGPAISPIEAHNERTKEQYASNPDIDTSRSRYNLHLVQPQGRYREEADRMISAAHCRVRKDSVRVVEALVTASPDFFKGKTHREVKAYFAYALKFLESRQRPDTFLSAVVHMDEKTPHLHLCFVPLTPDGRLSAKEIIGNRKNLVKWQDEFWQHMVKQYPELERGESASQTGREHIPPRIFKEMTQLPKQCSKHKRAPKTYQSNLALIQNLIIPYIGEMQMQKLRPYHIEALYDTLSKTPCGQYVGGKRRDLSPKQQKRTLSGTTLHEVHQLLHNSFLLAVEWGILIKSPVPMEAPKKTTQERSIWEVDEMRAALDSMEDPILHLAVHLTLVGALREGEVAGLTPEDIDFDAANGMGTFTVNRSMQRVQKDTLAQVDKGCILRIFPDKLEGSKTSLILKDTKTEASCRTIFMTAALREELKQWLERLKREEALDPERYRNSGMLLRLPNGLAVEPVLIRKKFLKWQDAHPEFPRIVFHGLRHSSATYQLMISGGDIKAVQGTTGHASADMLVNTYAHIQQSSRVELGKKFESGFYAKPDTPSPQAVPAAGEPTISMTALLELLKDADPEMKAKLRLALLT